MTPFPPPGVDAGATNMPNPDPSAPEGVQAVSDDLRLDLASVIHEAGCQCRGHKLGWTIRDRDAQQLAAGVLAAGYRRVSVDDATATRVGLAVRDAMTRVSDQDYDTAAEAWAEIGRAAVQALRDGGTA